MVDKYILASTGFCMVDNIVFVNKLPKEFQSLDDESVAQTPPDLKEIIEAHKTHVAVKMGGAEANVMRHIPDIETYFFGIVGNDENGSAYQQEITKTRMKFSLQIGEGENPSIYHMVDRKGRTVKFRTQGDSVDLLHQFHITHDIQDRLNDASGFYSSNFMYGSPMEPHLIKIYEQFKKSGRQLFFNFADTSRIQRDQVKLFQLLTHFHPDVLFMNTNELEEFVGEEVEKGVGHLSRLAGLVIATSAENVYVGRDGQMVYMHKVQKDEIRNTIGAGDCFASNFLNQYVKGANVANCVSAGANAAREYLIEQNQRN